MLLPASLEWSAGSKSFQKQSYTFTVLEKWTRSVIKKRYTVISIWLILIIFGYFASINLNSHLTTSLTVPGSDSAKTDAILYKNFNANIEGTFTVIYKFKNATKEEIAQYKEKIVRAANVIPTANVTQQKAIGGVLFASIGTSFKLNVAATYTEKFRKALDDQGLTKALVTGPPAINKDVTPVLAKDLKRGQILGVSLALLLLILVLGTCWAVLVPFFFAAATISVTLALVFLMSYKILMVLYIPNIIELIGLGLAIDYSLLIVHRFRREIMALEVTGARNTDATEALVRTIQTAGRTVVLSGLTVSIGIATLLLVPVPFVRSLGAAGLVVPLVAVIAAVTLQPALLSILGQHGVTSKGFQGLMARKDLADGMWAKIARFVIRKPVAVLIFSLVMLTITSVSVIWLQITPTSLTAIPGNLESARALTLLTDRAGPGVITPNEIIIDLGRPNLALTPEIKFARQEFANMLSKDPEVFVVATDEVPPYIDETAQYLRMFIIGQHDIGAEESQALVHKIREDYIPKATFPAGSKIYLGGAPAQGVDLIKTILTTFPRIILLALILVYLILLRAFRSVVLPLKAILMDLASIAVAYGSLVLVFRFGFASSILGTYRLDQIEAWVLVFLFAVLFGLSMDYEVFIVSRMREAWNRGISNNEAIVEGLSHTGGVVTAAAIILVGALSGLVIGHFAGLQQIGVGLAFGVLIDATIIRGLLLPSAMVLLGRWNWWLPSSIARVLKTKASPLESREARL